MNKHTPGPWKAETFAARWNVWPISKRKPDGSAVAYDCTEADARLIAAAPDLLEAAQQAADVLAVLYAKYQTRIGPFASQAQRANVLLGAAIAKATGATL